jgi:hypothetical protein
MVWLLYFWNLLDMAIGAQSLSGRDDRKIPAGILTLVIQLVASHFTFFT